VALASAAAFVDALRKSPLLTDGQRTVLVTQLQKQFPDLRLLARELVQRSWLTVFQVNQVLQGNAAALVVGPYLIQQRLGEGGVGQVFSARHQHMNRLVALKLIRQDVLADKEAVGRFQREVQVISQLTHPNVVQAYDAGPIGTNYFLAMELIEGTDLNALVEKNGPLPVAQAVDYIRQAALGLQHIHERGLVHRDIKPSNLLVAKSKGDAGSNVVKILDLGLARLEHQAKKDPTGNLTGTLPVTMGTLDYMPPEQALDFHNADIRSDIYSLGCSFYFLLTGRSPVGEGTMPEKLMRHQQVEPPHLAQFRRDVPAALGAVLAKMMAKRPEDRFQTPKEVAQALTTVDPSTAIQGKQTTHSVAPPTLISAGPITGQAPSPGRGRAILRGLRWTAIKTWAIAGPLVKAFWRYSPRLFLGTSAALLLVCVGTCFIMFGSWGPPLDRLNARNIPKEERYDWQPSELVGVLGEHRWRHGYGVGGLAVSRDGKWVATPGSDGCLWEAKTGRLVMKIGEGSIHSVAVNRDSEQWAAGGENRLLILDIAGRKELFKFALPGYYTAVAYSADGKKFAAARVEHKSNEVREGTIHIWDASTHAELVKFGPYPNTISTVAFAPDDKTVVFAGNFRDGTLRRGDLSTGKEVEPWGKSQPGGEVRRVVFTADGKTLLWRWEHEYRHRVSSHDLLNGNEKELFPGGNTTAFAPSPDGKWLAIGDPEGRITLIDTGNDSQQAFAVRHFREVLALAFSPDSKTLYSAGNDGTVRPWDVANRVERVPTQGHLARIRTVAVSSDGGLVASGGDDGTVRLWKIPGGQMTDLRSEAGIVNSLDFSPDGTVLAAGHDGGLQLWLLNKNNERITLRGQSGRVAGVGFSPDGLLLASYAHTDKAEEQTVKLWNVESRRETSTISAKWREHIRGMVFNSDGATLLLSDKDKSWKAFDVKTQQELPSPPWLAGEVTAVGFGPPRKTLAVGTQESIRLWDDPLQAKQRIELRPPSRVWYLVFSKDGRSLVSWCEDRTLIQWQVTDGTKLHTITLPTRPAALAVARDNRHVIVANGNGTIYIYRLPPLPG
jgi:WD40 repeat protein/serine/threonine protein kinase